MVYQNVKLRQVIVNFEWGGGFWEEIVVDV